MAGQRKSKSPPSKAMECLMSKETSSKLVDPDWDREIIFANATMLKVITTICCGQPYLCHNMAVWFVEPFGFESVVQGLLIIQPKFFGVKSDREIIFINVTMVFRSPLTTKKLGWKISEP